jgi:hypothetical protein
MHVRAIDKGAFHFGYLVSDFFAIDGSIFCCRFFFFVCSASRSDKQQPCSSGKLFMSIEE